MAKLLPPAKTDAQKINYTKVKPKVSKVSPIGIGNTKVLLGIHKKVVKIDKLLKDSLVLKQKDVRTKRVSKESEKFKQRENELEGKKLPKIKGINLPSLPKLGFFDWIKNFIFNTFLGFLSIKLIDHLPKLIKLLPIIFKVGDFFIDIGGKLLDGLVTFIDWGYKAYDATRGFTKNLFGESGVKQFDKLSSVLNQFLNLAIIAGMVAAGSGRGGGFGGKGGGGSARPRPGQGGRPRITTTGGAGTGRPDIRNPLRQRPTITTSGGGRAGGFNFRNPFRARPVITTSGGAAKGVLSSIRPFLKRIPLPVIGALIDFGLSVALGENPGRAAFRAIGAGLLGAVGAAIGSVVPIAGNIIGGVVGGMAGDAAGGALYDLFFGGKKVKPGRLNKLAGGGKPIPKAGEKRPVTRSLRKRKKARSLSIVPQKIKPGRNAGGEKEVQKVFPNPDKPGGLVGFLGGLFGGGNQQQDQQQTQQKPKEKTANPQEFLIKSNDILGKADFFGPFFTLALKSVLGDKPGKIDYMNIGKGLNSWIQTTFKTGTLGFAGGGEVDAKQFFEGQDYSDVIAKTVEDSVSKEVGSTIRDLAKELALQPVGREEMIEKNIERGTEPGAETGDIDDQTVGGGGAGGGIYKPILDLIAKYEAGAGGWESMYPRTRLRGATKMTIAQVASRASGAVGMYQNMPEYLVARAKAVGLDPNRDLYNEENQRKIAVYLIERGQAGVTPKMLKDNPDEAMIRLAKVWAAIPVPKDMQGHRKRLRRGESYYAGVGSNKAHITPEMMYKAMGASVKLQQNLEKGVVDSGTIPSKGGKAFPLPKGQLGTGSGQVYGAPRSYGGHAGVDVVERPPWGRDPKLPVVAYSGGKVVNNGPVYPYKTSGYTSNLTIDHGGFKATYLHMKPSLRPGTMVSPGQKVGNLLDLGNQTHLHFEAYDKSGKTINPTKILQSAYEKGGETLDGPHQALIGEKGKEYVIDADSYRATEKVAPGILDILNYDVKDKVSLQNKIPSIISILSQYTDYEQPQSEIQYVEVPVEVPYEMPSERDSLPFAMGGGGIDNSEYEVLEML